MMMSVPSATVFARRSLSYLMNGQPELALRDAMQAQVCVPEWPTSFYLQALALSKLGMEKDAQDMLNEGAAFEGAAVRVPCRRPPKPWKRSVGDRRTEEFVSLLTPTAVFLGIILISDARCRRSRRPLFSRPWRSVVRSVCGLYDFAQELIRHISVFVHAQPPFYCRRTELGNLGSSDTTIGLSGPIVDLSGPVTGLGVVPPSSFYYHLSVDNLAAKPQIPKGHPPPPSRTSSASFAPKVTLSSSVQIYLFLLSNDSLSSTSKLKTYGASAFSSPAGPRRLSHSSTEVSFCMRPSFSCTITFASAPTSSDTFPTPSVVDDGFYTCSLMSSFL
ncbi:hypothetical protein BHM03_00016869 [Ensete ventricosum]|nr:hypothetical protein BHM03_00016869 [Ensete ventricosum]